MQNRNSQNPSSIKSYLSAAQATKSPPKTDVIAPILQPRTNSTGANQAEADQLMTDSTSNDAQGTSDLTFNPKKKSNRILFDDSDEDMSDGDEARQGKVVPVAKAAANNAKPSNKSSTKTRSKATFTKSTKLKDPPVINVDATDDDMKSDVDGEGKKEVFNVAKIVKSTSNDAKTTAIKTKFPSTSTAAKKKRTIINDDSDEDMTYDDDDEYDYDNNNYNTDTNPFLTSTDAPTTSLPTFNAPFKVPNLNNTTNSILRSKLNPYKKSATSNTTSNETKTKFTTRFGLKFNGLGEVAVSVHVKNVLNSVFQALCSEGVEGTIVLLPWMPSSTEPALVGTKGRAGKSGGITLPVEREKLEAYMKNCWVPATKPDPKNIRAHYPKLFIGHDCDAIAIVRVASAALSPVSGEIEIEQLQCADSEVCGEFLYSTGNMDVDIIQETIRCTFNLDIALKYGVPPDAKVKGALPNGGKDCVRAILVSAPAPKVNQTTTALLKAFPRGAKPEDYCLGIRLRFIPLEKNVPTKIKPTIRHFLQCQAQFQKDIRVLDLPMIIGLDHPYTPPGQTDPLPTMRQILMSFKSKLYLNQAVFHNVGYNKYHKKYVAECFYTLIEEAQLAISNLIPYCRHYWGDDCYGMFYSDCWEAVETWVYDPHTGHVTAPEMDELGGVEDFLGELDEDAKEKFPLLYTPRATDKVIINFDELNDHNLPDRPAINEEANITPKKLSFGGASVITIGHGTQSTVTSPLTTTTSETDLLRKFAEMAAENPGMTISEYLQSLNKPQSAVTEITSPDGHDGVSGGGTV